MGFRIGPSSIAEAGRIAHPPDDPAATYTPPIGRSLVIGDALYTLSYAASPPIAWPGMPDTLHSPERMETP